MVRERGYRGGSDHFRAIVARFRPRPVPEAYLRLRTLAGEQAQCDWAHFGTITIGKASRPLMAFVMVLSYSRHLFLRFYLNGAMNNFLRGHVEAFTAWGAVPRVVLYDNLKSAVLERRSDAIRFHPTLLELAAHYRFQPRPVAVARGNEKGRVERAIRFVRDRFFAARAFKDIHDLNAQATTWCLEEADLRGCPEDRDRAQQIEDPRHVEALEAHKRAGRAHRALDRLHHAAPESKNLYKLAAERGVHLGVLTRGLLQLLDTHGADALAQAIDAALGENAAHLGAVRHFIDAQLALRGERPPVAVTLPNDPRLHITVRAHDLRDYEQLTTEPTDEHEPAERTLKP
jgi:transposase